MTDVRQILDDLDLIRNSGYGLHLLGEHDAKFIELAEYYVQCETAEKETIRASVGDELRLLLIGFGDRMAILAARTANTHFLLLALVAHSIEDFRYDDREDIVRLALVDHIARKLHVRPANLFEEAALMSSIRGASALRAFNNRPSELKSLRSMGIIEEQTDEGINYRYRQRSNHLS